MKLASSWVHKVKPRTPIHEGQKSKALGHRKTSTDSDIRVLDLHSPRVTIMSRLVWLITGCSSGFGEQFVHSIIARGDKVVATARKLEKIKHLEKTGAATLQLDLTDTQTNLNNKIAEATKVYGKIDVLVNNAAFITIGTWEQLG
jgi:hypothetical protein